MAKITTVNSFSAIGPSNWEEATYGDLLPYRDNLVSLIEADGTDIRVPISVGPPTDPSVGRTIEIRYHEVMVNLTTTPGRPNRRQPDKPGEPTITINEVTWTAPEDMPVDPDASGALFPNSGTIDVVFSDQTVNPGEYRFKVPTTNQLPPAFGAEILPGRIVWAVVRDEQDPQGEELNRILVSIFYRIGPPEVS